MLDEGVLRVSGGEGEEAGVGEVEVVDGDDGGREVVGGGAEGAAEGADLVVCLVVVSETVLYSALGLGAGASGMSTAGKRVEIHIESRCEARADSDCGIEGFVGILDLLARCDSTPAQKRNRRL